MGWTKLLFYSKAKDKNGSVQKVQLFPNWNILLLREIKNSIEKKKKKKEGTFEVDYNCFQEMSEKIVSLLFIQK